MSRSISKIVAATLMIVFVIALFPGMRLKAATSGTCGNNATWTLDDEGTLTISGTGSICNNAFENNTDITNVIIESDIEDIGSSAFENCTSLESITIPNSVTSIGAKAFRGCRCLRSITIPNSVTSIDDSAFACSGLKSITIPYSVTSIGKNAFSGCLGLTSITIKKSLYKNCEDAFPDMFSDAFHFYAEYEITFKNYDDTVLESKKVAVGETPSYTGSVTPTKPSKDGYWYQFAGWDPIPEAITGPATYYAVYNRIEIKYKVKFVDLDGITIQSDDLTYLKVPVFTGKTPTKEEDETYTYVFAGWTDGNTTYGINEELPQITCDTTFKPVFRAVPKPEYEITFKNYDDTVLESKKVKAGETPSYTGTVTPTRPSDGRYYYQFAGWDPIPGAVTGPATYTAVYDKTVIKEAKYTVTFVDNDNVEIYSTTLYYRTAPIYTGKTPVKNETDSETFTFIGWTDGNITYGLNEDLPRIEKDTIFKPVFKAEPKPVYTVGEVKGDGIKSDIVIDVHRNVDDENCLTYFLSATIDGTEMKINDQYTATKGSTIITIKKDFLSTLPAGEHEVQVVFNDGSISTKVTIAAKASVPSTGEVTGPATYIGLALIVTACVCGTGVVLLKKRKEA